MSRQRTQVIEFVEWRELRSPFEHKDTYELREDRHSPWLQRTLFWALGKLGAFSKGESITTERYVIEADDFMERLFKQEHALEGYFNRKPTRLFIGADDYAQLMNHPTVSHYFAFDAQYHYGREVHGLRVTVVPWMRGMLVMPD